MTSPCPLELARVRLADWHPSALECFTNHLRVSPPFVVQLALLRDVPEVQGIGVGLVRIRGTVAEHDDVSAGAKHLQEIGNRWGRLAHADATTSAAITSAGPEPRLSHSNSSSVRECDQRRRRSQGHVAAGSKLMMRDSGRTGIRGRR